MTLFDALNLNHEFLGRLRDAGGRIDDIDYLELFEEFRNIVATGDKVSFAVSALALKYGVSQRTIYSIIKRFKKPLQD